MSHSVCSVGLDVSKATVEVAILLTNQQHIAHSCANTPAGLIKLATWLKQQGVAKTTPCVIESTGDYHLLSAITLTNVGFTINVINPLITKQYQRSSLQDTKTDKVDARRLARIGHLEDGLAVFSAKLSQIGAKKILSLIAKLEQLKQQLSSSVHRFKETQELLGLPVNCEGIDEIFNAIDQQLSGLSKQLTNHVSPRLNQLVRHTPGLSQHQVAVISSAIAGAKFSNRNQLVAFTGLAIRQRQSGTWRGREKLTKRGNPYLRKTLFQIAWGLMMHHPVYRAYYQELRANGKHYTTCLIAVARKFLRFFYAYYVTETITLSTVK